MLVQGRCLVHPVVTAVKGRRRAQRLFGGPRLCLRKRRHTYFWLRVACAVSFLFFILCRISVIVFFSLRSVAWWAGRSRSVRLR